MDSSPIAASRSRLVEETIRTSTAKRRLPPTGSTIPSCSTRSSLACSGWLISVISSRSKVPPCACSNLPARLSCASVNAPFS